MARAEQSARRQPEKQQPAIGPEYITRKHTAALLQCSDQLISKWIKAGQLRAYRLGTHAIRVRRSDIDALMQQWTTPDPTEVRL
jgi:excisionase family DNA binding protein